MKQCEVMDGRVGLSSYAFVLWKRNGRKFFYRIKGVQKQVI
jgi:hypothetical protein